MDDIKLFVKNEKKRQTLKLILAVIIYSDDIGIEFSTEKWKAENDKWCKEKNHHINEKWERLEKKKRRKEERGLTSVQDSVNAAIQRLRDF